MSLFAKIMVVVNFILAVAFLAAAGTLLGAAEDYKGKYEAQLTTAKAEQDRLNLLIDAERVKVTAGQKSVTDLSVQKTAAETTMAGLKASSDAVEAANKDLRDSVKKFSESQKDLQGKNSELQKDIALAQSDNAKLKTESAQRAEQIRNLTDEVARLNQDKETAEKSAKSEAEKSTALADQLDQAKTTLERYRKEAGPLKTGIAMKDVHGVVQAAQDNLDIYVLSVGKKDGVEAGYEFTIYRGSEYIATIVIDKVFDNVSSGMTKPGTKRKAVQAGDEAATRL